MKSKESRSTIGAQTMRDEVEPFFSRFKKTKSPATNHSTLVTSHSSLHTARSADFWALRDVSFKVWPGRLRELSLEMAGTMGTGLLDMIDLW